MKKYISILITGVCLVGNISAQIVLLDSLKLKSDGVDIEIYQDTLLYVASHNVYTPGYTHNRPDAGAINIIGDTLVMIPGYSNIDAHVISSRIPSELKLTDSLIIGGNSDDFLYYNLSTRSSIALRDLTQAVGVSQDISSARNKNGDFVTVITNVPDGFRIITNTFQTGTQALNRGFYGVELRDNMVYAGADDSTLITFDLSAGVFTDTVELAGIARGIVTADTFLFCGNGNKVSSFSIADPLHPRWLEDVIINGPANDVVVAGKRLYVVSGVVDSLMNGSITVVAGGSELTNLSKEDELFLDSPVWGIDVDPRDGNIFYVTTADSMLYAVALDEFSSLEEQQGDVPENILLFQNYPNPFNPNTTIQYILKEKQFVKLNVYDMLGKEVTSLVHEEQPAGTYRIVFDATDKASGTYFYRLEVDGQIRARRMLLLK